MNMEKLMKSFEAFINHDTATATSLYREYFIESAQAINAEHEEELEEAFGGDPESDLVDEVVAEGFGDDEGQADPFGAEDEGAAEESEGDFGSDDEVEGEPVEVPADEWQEIQDQFDELEALFAELGDGEGQSDDLSFDEEGGEDEIVFGDDEDDQLEESIQMKNVSDPGMKSETGADNVKPVLAKQAKSPVNGVSATAGYAGDGTVKGSNTKRDNPDSEKPKVEDRNNVMQSGKKAYKPASQKGAASSEKDADSNAKKSLIKDIRP